jgi:hypothetical protein
MRTYGGGGVADTAPRILNLGIAIMLNGQLHASAALVPKEKARNPLDKRLRGPQGRPSHCIKETIPTLPGVESLS